MIRVLCDRCDKTIDCDEQSWFGVDYTAPPEPIIVDGEDTGMTEVRQLSMDHEFHFCTVDCLTTWAFDRAFTPSEGTTA